MTTVIEPRGGWVGLELSCAAARTLQMLFPGRHQLVRGRSDETIPQTAAAQPENKCDYFFVDGEPAVG